MVDDFLTSQSAVEKILFQNQFLAIVERDGYTFLRETRCDGVIVSVLPFRTRGKALEFLARLEICPAHGPAPELCSITGGLQSDETIEGTAQNELWEEAGIRVAPDELIDLGHVRPSKSADTIAYLFAVDVTEKSQSIPRGDGTHLEASASVRWVNCAQGLQIKDPLFVTAIARLMEEKEKWNFQE